MESKNNFNMLPARFEHDCDDCVYLGQYKAYDLYCCVKEPTVIARFSSDGPDYASGLIFAEPNGVEPLYEAKKRAIRMRLLTD